jgi:hypothetical protein
VEGPHPPPEGHRLRQQAKQQRKLRREQAKAAKTG